MQGANTHASFSLSLSLSLSLSASLVPCLLLFFLRYCCFSSPQVMVKLMRAAQGPELRWLVRALCMNMRIGATAVTCLQALGKAFWYHMIEEDRGTSERYGCSQGLHIHTYTHTHTHDRRG